MVEYVNCQNCGNKDCSRYGKGYGYTFCNCYVHQKKITNADRIRCMSDEELALYFAEMATEDIYDDPGAWLVWLQKPAKED